MKLFLFTPFLALGLAAGAHAQTNLLSDGDFEAFTGQVADGGYTPVNGGMLGAWTVTGGVDLIRNNFGAITDVSVDMAGTPGPGMLSQTFSAVAGMTYTLSWDLSANPPGMQLDVGFGGATTSYAAVNGVTHQMISWTATTSGLQTVSFAAGEGYQGPVIDNIMLTAAVPEPETYALMLAGLTAVGFVAGRRRRS